MSYPMNEVYDDVRDLAEDAGELVEATASAVGRQRDEFRKGISSAMNTGREHLGAVRKRAMRDVKAADVAVHDHVYESILLGVGIGILVGFFASRRIA